MHLWRRPEMLRFGEPQRRTSSSSRLALSVRLGSILVLVLTVLAAWNGGVALGQPLSQAPNVNNIEDLHAGLADIDTRTAFLQPSAAQLQQVAALGASASWNKFGTPASLINYNDVLVSG